MATKPAPLSRKIYLALREGIIRGRYPQGSRLAEQRLAEELQVSRVPLREAVPLLEVDGFVQTLPRRTAIVTVWTERSAHDLFDLRLCLEVGAARYAARQVATGASTAALEAAVDRTREGLDSTDAYRIAADSTQFQETIVDLADNELMRSVTRSMTGRMMWLCYLTSQSDLSARDLRDGLRSAEDLVTAIRSGDERVAESVAYTRIEADRRESRKKLTNLNQAGLG